MTPVLRYFKRKLEKYVGTWYEGPSAPQRLQDMVIEFANLHPLATRLEWAYFAAEHAAEAYRQGWLRGYEYVERDPDWNAFVSRASPDQLADAMDPNWRASEAVELDEPNETVPPFEPSPKRMIDHLMKLVRKQDERRK